MVVTIIAIVLVSSLLFINHQRELLFMIFHICLDFFLGELYTVACGPIDARLVTIGGGDDQAFL